jgi:predicted phage terminase large subunit-like protein
MSLASEHVLLPYQIEWLRCDAHVRVWEKSRRIGASWCAAAGAVLDAARRTAPVDTWYVGYNEDMTREFISDCEMWARAFHAQAIRVGEDVYADERGDIRTFHIRMASGGEIRALSSRPTNLRAKGGNAIIDEAAFHDDLPGLLKAAMAFRVWGGRISIISTHNGVGSDFHKLCEEIRAGKRDAALFKTTFDDAVSQGLYERVMQRTGQVATDGGRQAWRDGIWREYGIDAPEELGCIPSDYGAGELFPRTAWRIIERHEVHLYTRWVRAWDRASSERPDADATAGCRMGIEPGGRVVIADMHVMRRMPDAVLATMRTLAEQDGNLVAIFRDPASAGTFEAQMTVAALAGREVRVVNASSTGGKITMAKPLASQVLAGNACLVRGPWNDAFMAEAAAFPSRAHDDQVDAASLAYYVLTASSGVVACATGPTRSSD